MGRALIVSAVVCCLQLVAARADDAVQRAPEPPADARVRAEAQVREIYQADISSARTAAAKAELAKKVLRESADAGSRGAERHAMLKLSIDLAVDAADEQAASEAIDALTGAFSVDAFKLRAETLLALAKRPNLAQSKASLANRLSNMAGEGVQLGDVELAQNLAAAAVAAAKKSKDADTIRATAALARDVSQLRAGYEQAAEARKTLAKDPAAPAANSQLGQFSCFLLGDWRAGLRLLRLSDEAAYRSLAERESKAPLPLAETIGIGDEWWTVADKQTGVAKRNIRLHAAELYQAALPELEGLAKIRITKRLEEAGVEPLKIAPKPNAAEPPKAPASIADAGPSKIPAIVGDPSAQGPQFPRDALVYRDDFSKAIIPNTAGQSAFGAWQEGVKDGRFYMSIDSGANQAVSHRTRLLPWSGSDFAIQVTGRVRGNPGDVWEVNLQSQSEKIELGVALSNAGKVTIAPSAMGFAQEGPRLDPLKPANMKAGEEFNTVLIVAVQQRAWVHVNGVQICGPLELPNGIHPAKIRLAFKSSRGAAEFKDLSIWSVKQFPLAAEAK